MPPISYPGETTDTQQAMDLESHLVKLTTKMLHLKAPLHLNGFSKVTDNNISILSRAEEVAHLQVTVDHSIFFQEHKATQEILEPGHHFGTLQNVKVTNRKLSNVSKHSREDPCYAHKGLNMFCHALGMLVHQNKESHSTRPTPHLLEILQHIRGWPVVEEGPHVDDILVWWELAEHIIFILVTCASL